MAVPKLLCLPPKSCLSMSKCSLFSCLLDWQMSSLEVPCTKLGMPNQFWLFDNTRRDGIEKREMFVQGTPAQHTNRTGGRSWPCDVRRIKTQAFLRSDVHGCGSVLFSGRAAAFLEAAGLIGRITAFVSQCLVTVWESAVVKASADLFNSPYTAAAPWPSVTWCWNEDNARLDRVSFTWSGGVSSSYPSAILIYFRTQTKCQPFSNALDQCSNEVTS